MTLVPRLDLAPKLKRPLSLWNPLDYLRLLYWVFYFPQALRWYVDTFRGWHKIRDLLRQNAVRLILLILLVLITLLLLLSLDKKLILSSFFPVIITDLFGTLISFFAVIITDLLLTLLGTIPLERRWNYVYMSRNTAWFVTKQFSDILVEPGLMFIMWIPITYIPLITAVQVFTLIDGISQDIWFATIILFIFRPDAWFFSLPLSILHPADKRRYSHITPIPIPFLSSRLTNWLRRDWEVGLDNIKNLLSYTLQFIPIVQAINKVLVEIPDEQIIFRLVQVIELPDGWNLIYCFSTFIIRHDCIFSDIPAHTAAAGFWHLHEKEPAHAATAFAVVRSLLYGEEMYTLAETLGIFYNAKDLSSITNISYEARQNVETRNFASLQLSSENLLRPNTWQAINSLYSVVEDTQLIKASASRAVRAFALNRAIGEVTQIIDTQDILPEAERGLIVDIAQTWKIALERLTKEVGQVAITKPVINPYIVGDPVEGEFFVGREDIMRQLEELWLMGHNIQSVVLFGHRRMGKTSILRNLSQRLGTNVKIAYVNLLNSGVAQTEGELLMALSDRIAQVINIAPPDDDKLLNLPYPTFQRFMTKVVDTLREKSLQEKSLQEKSLQGLIIAVDEFEVIEELIKAGRISPEFMGYLRSLVQMSPKVGFVLAGLHTLEEMIADYFQPLYASFTPPIKVSFMEAGATQVILANPGVDDFPLDYKREALVRIYELTHGQPFLVQLVGFQLVRSYNDFVFEMGRKRDPAFTVEDVEAVINDAAFFQRGRYYFEGVWKQAAQGVDGQQAVLRILAPHPAGLGVDEICGLVEDLDNVTILAALETLRSHDVVIDWHGRWLIAVELFRRWVLLPR